MAECAVAGCEGVPSSFGACVGHVDDEQFEELLAGNAMILTARAAIDPARARRLVEGGFGVSEATIIGLASFKQATFHGDANFREARFTDGVDFDGARFEGAVQLNGVHITGDLHARDAVFAQRVDFADAHVDFASFNGATFSGPVSFLGSRFAALTADGACFHGDQDLGDIVAAHRVSLSDITAEARFDLRVDTPTVSLVKARLQGGGRLDVRASRVVDRPANVLLHELRCDVPFTVVGVPRLDSGPELQGGEAEEVRAIALRKRAEQLRAPAPEPQISNEDYRTRLAGYRDILDQSAEDFDTPALQLRAREIREAIVALEAAVAQPATESGEDRTRRIKELELRAVRHHCAAMTTALERLADRVQTIADIADTGVSLPSATAAGGHPRILRLEDVDLAKLTLSGVDMSACQFSGAQNLDRARIDGVFARSPGTWRWSRRLIIAEERTWHIRRGAREWRRPECGPQKFAEPLILHGEAPPDAAQLAEVYRSLRKAREDAKDEPGAADFYYGEMEMRRHSSESATARSSGRGERVVLRLYWLVSGYGLRASRALIALLVTIVAFAALLYIFGLKERDVSVAVLQSIQGAAFRAGDETVLTEGGQYLQIPLRLLGPLFFGLALLSLRNRVKR